MNNTYRPQIEKYLDRNMTDSERQSFERALKSDVSLQKAMTLYAIGPDPEDLILEEDYAADDTSPSKPFLRYFAGAALILLTAALAYVFWPKPPIETLATGFAAAICAGNAGTDVLKAEFDQAAAIYCKQALTDAEKMANLESLKATCPLPFCPSLYYLAHSYMLNKRYPEAVTAFENCLQHFDSTLKSIPETRSAKPTLQLNLIYAKIGARFPAADLRNEITRLKPELSGTLLTQATALEAALSAY